MFVSSSLNSTEYTHFDVELEEESDGDKEENYGDDGDDEEEKSDEDDDANSTKSSKRLAPYFDLNCSGSNVGSMLGK